MRPNSVKGETTGFSTVDLLSANVGDDFHEMASLRLKIEATLIEASKIDENVEQKN